jgi:uncharacterized DUF497 family protein
MDFHFLYLNQPFVWNVEKASSNLRKHGIRFEIAAQVFFDRLVQVQDASVDDETREAAIGATEDATLLLVIHIHREDDTIRIISARPATAHERRAYENAE